MRNAPNALARTIVEDLVECSAAADLFATPESVAPMTTVPCLLTLAWSEKDH